MLELPLDRCRVDHVSPNIGRFLPLIVIFAAIIFIVPALAKKHSSGPSGKSKATATTDALTRVTSTEKSYLAAHGHYTSHLADLVAASPGLAADLATGVTVTLDVASSGKSFLTQVSSDQLMLVRSRDATGVLVNRCTALKSGVKCP
jgi:hypothetical protein